MSSRSRQTRSGLSSNEQPLPATVSGVPRKVCAALDALDEPDLTAVRVMSAPVDYLHIVSLPRADLAHEHNDWTEFVIPDVRGVLERAMDALPARHAELVWQVVREADEQLRTKTLNNPLADQSCPWWARLWWH